MRPNADFKNEPATVIDHGFALSSEKKTPYWWGEFQFDELIGDNGERVTVKAYLYMTEKSLDYTLQKLANIGWSGNDVTELDPNEAGAHNFKGAKALLTGHIENKEGKVRAVVDFINDPNWTPDKPVDKKTASVLNAKLRGKIASFRNRNGVAQKTPASAAASMFGTGKEKKAEKVEEEIPF